MPNIGLHHLCALELTATELVRLASKLEFTTISSFTQGLAGGQSQFPLINQSNKKEPSKHRFKTAKHRVLYANAKYEDSRLSGGLSFGR